MIGLDTNVVVRYLVQDDKRQAAIATRFMESTLSAEARGHISHVTLCELTWVLARCYGVKKLELVIILESLLTTKQLHIDHAELVWKALRVFEAGLAEFADALIAQGNLAAGCSHTVTFDKKAATVPGYRILA